MRPTKIRYLAESAPDQFYWTGTEQAPTPILPTRKRWRLPAKVLEFIRAWLGPRASRREVRIRLDICGECEHRQVKGDGAYCGACGCPKWGPAELKNKTRLVKATCPLMRWPIGDSADDRHDAR